MTNYAAKGFPYEKDIIMSFVGGSTLFGTAIEGSDEDVYGVFIPPPEKLLGVDSYEHFTFKQPDIAMHSLQKFVGLAIKGNPTVLTFLFANEFANKTICRKAWQVLLDNRELFLAKSHATAFYGYAESQMQLFHKHQRLGTGFDTKNALHCMRLYFELGELLQTGKITYPRPERKFLLQIRNGEISYQQWLVYMEKAKAETKRLEAESKLPERIDRNAVGKLVAQIHMDYWNKVL